MIELLANKKNIWFIVSSLVLIIVIASTCFNLFFIHRKTSNIEQMEYRTDIEPLIERFGETIDIDSCFWKADTIGKTSFGPSSYWLKGFIIISYEALNEFKKKYSFTKVDICFDEGISPDITNFSDFYWTYNKELSDKISGMGFIGEFYLDINNGILYFDLESN